VAPKFSTSPSVDQWWKKAYDNVEHIHAQYSLEWNGETISPGTKIKFKNLRGTFKFRCLANNVETGSTWIDCVDCDSGEWRSFRVEKLKGIVKPKKSRRRKKNETIPVS
jgi:hypothetical protein